VLTRIKKNALVFYPMARKNIEGEKKKEKIVQNERKACTEQKKNSLIMDYNQFYATK